MTKQKELLELRALALLISSQNLAFRRRALELAQSGEANLRNALEAEFPALSLNARLLSASADLVRYQQRGVLISCLFENDFPSFLRTVEDPPLILFYKGRALAELEARCCLAIVGSRRADPDGLAITREFARDLARFGIVIVSGLALGVDGAAHEGALEGGLNLSTVAVLGSGLDVIYPPHHSELAQSVVEQGGILISQFEPPAAPYPSNFLNRNRIISGLSKAVLVVQATLRSGSLVTARNALEQGKEVLVVPGDISNPRYEGSHRLIQQGASLVTSVSEIVEALGISEVAHQSPGKVSGNGHKQPLATKIERDIVNVLRERNEMRVDELVRLLGSVSFEKELLLLELGGVIQRLPGNVLRLKK